MEAVKPSEKLINVPMEQALLGDMLIDPDAIGKALEIVSAEDFHVGSHARLFEALKRLHDQQSRIDVQIIADEMGDDLKELGTDPGGRGIAYMTWIIGKTPSAMHVREHARVVNRLSTLRRMVRVAGQIAKAAYEDREELDELFGKARRWLDSIRPEASHDDAILYWLESLSLFVDLQLERKADEIAREEGEQFWIDFPWKGVKQLVSHLRAGTLCAIAAEPGVGKTSFMEQAAEHWAKQGIRVVFFHLELNHAIMIDRRTCRHSGVPMEALERGDMPDAALKAIDSMKPWAGGITYVHSPRWSAARIARTARTLHSKGLCDIVIVDYLQKLRLDYEHGAVRAQALGDAIELLKSSAEQLGIPYVIGSQFSKGSRDKKIKTSDDIRDTGELEDKANVMFMLDRQRASKNMPDLDIREGDRGPSATLRADKNTLGKTGSCSLRFEGDRFRFMDSGPPIMDSPPPEEREDLPW